MEDSSAADGKVSKEFFSKLVKADIHGKDQVYSKNLIVFVLVGIILYPRSGIFKKLSCKSMTILTNFTPPPRWGACTGTIGYKVF